MDYQEDSTALEESFPRQVSLFHDANTVKKVNLGRNKRFQMGVLSHDFELFQRTCRHNIGKGDLFCTSQD